MQLFVKKTLKPVYAATIYRMVLQDGIHKVNTYKRYADTRKASSTLRMHAKSGIRKGMPIQKIGNAYFVPLKGLFLMVWVQKGTLDLEKAKSMYKEGQEQYKY